jgi:hypothetical protein
LSKESGALIPCKNKTRKWKLVKEEEENTNQCWNQGFLNTKMETMQVVDNRRLSVARKSTCNVVCD